MNTHEALCLLDRDKLVAMLVEQLDKVKSLEAAGAESSKREAELERIVDAAKEVLFTELCHIKKHSDDLISMANSAREILRSVRKTRERRERTPF